jgi:ATP/maltotriose-dependent transcriptional regulator MalT
VSQVLIARAFVASARGEHERADELAAEAVELADAHEYVTIQQRIRFRQGELLLVAGRREEARAALERTREVAARKGSTVIVERADALLSDLAASG